MATENTGGWQLTTATYALGGRMETVGADGKVTATLNNAADQGGPRRTSRPCAGTTTPWGRPSTTRGAPSTRPSPSGQIGMFTGGSDLYTAMVQNNNLNPADYGVSVIPLASDPNAGVLGGGTLAAVNVVTTDAQRDAAVEWIDFYYMQKLLTQDGRRRRCEGAQGQQPAGRRARPCRSSTRPPTTQSQDWIKDYINVPDGPDDPVHVEDLRPAARH